MSAWIWEEDGNDDLQLVDIGGSEVGLYWELDGNDDAMPRVEEGPTVIAIPTLSVTDYGGNPSVGGTTIVGGSTSGTTNEVWYMPKETGQTWAMLTTTTDDGTEIFNVSTGVYWGVVKSIDDNSGLSVWGVLNGVDEGPITFDISDTDNPLPRTGHRERRRNRIALAALRVHKRLATKCTFVEADESTTEVWCALEPLTDTAGIIGGVTDERRVIFHIARQPNFPPDSIDWLGSYILFESRKYGVMNVRMDNETETMTSVFSFVCAIHGYSVEY